MKEMELKDLQSDLEALRKLYGLLQCGGDVQSNVVLGERSKLLLKDLLDGATERVLETHKKIIAAAEHGVCATSCSSESEKCRAVPDSLPSVLPYELKAAPGVIRNSMKESNHHAVRSPKDEGCSNKLTTQEGVSQQSRLSFSLDKPENRKKCSEFSKQSSMKQQSTARFLSRDSKHQSQQHDPLGYFYQASGGERNLLERNEKCMKLVKSNETMRQRSLGRFKAMPSIVGSVAGSSRSLASGDNIAKQNEKKGEAANNFSKDIDNVVKHIESHISALRLCSKLADATKGAVPHGLCDMPTSVCPMVQAKEHLVKKNELSHSVEPFSDKDELLLIQLENQGIGKKDDSHGSHQVLGQSENDLLEDITSKKRRIQQKELGQTSEHIVSTDRLNKMVGNQNVNGMVEAGDHKQSHTTSCYVHGLRVPIKQDNITKRPPMPVKMPYLIPTNNGGKEPTPKIGKLRPSIPSQSAGSKASVRPISDKKGLARQILWKQKEGGMGILHNKILLHQQDSEDSATAGSGSSDSEAYSLPSRDSAASVSRRLAHGAYEESSSSDYRDVGESSSSDYRDVGESGRSYPTRTHKAIRPVNSDPDKAKGRLGRLRRFKNKLGLIFHHHHRSNHNDSCGHSRDVHTKSKWTHLHKVFHPRNRHQVQDKIRKARGSNVPVKHQGGHFHALVEGLMQHLKHSKKSKPSKGGIGWPANGQDVHKNRKVKQIHWWQMFQRQRGVKLPNKRRVKIGFMSKKQQLRVPKLRYQTVRQGDIMY
ncbi:hypothetical protein QQP08_002909 [Theobroma cacao]|nr:hypothetical protein QQP08_002909 [Theobroma cacao]